MSLNLSPIQKVESIDATQVVSVRSTKDLNQLLNVNIGMKDTEENSIDHTVRKPKLTYLELVKA